MLRVRGLGSPEVVGLVLFLVIVRTASDISGRRTRARTAPWRRDMSRRSDSLSWPKRTLEAMLQSCGGVHVGPHLPGQCCVKHLMVYSAQDRDGADAALAYHFRQAHGGRRSGSTRLVAGLAARPGRDQVHGSRSRGPNHSSPRAPTSTRCVCANLIASETDSLRGCHLVYASTEVLEVPVFVTTRMIPRIFGSCGVVVPPACHCEMGLVSSAVLRRLGHFLR